MHIKEVGPCIPHEIQLVQVQDPADMLTLFLAKIQTPWGTG